MSVDANVIIAAVTAGGGIATLIWGIHTFRKNNKDSQLMKKKEILTDVMFPLISEYNSSKEIEIATNILDDKPFQLRGETGVFASDERPRYPNNLINKENLTIALRNHENDPTTPEEDEVRESFDSLLSFFAKLEYVLSIGLVERQNLTLFDYFIQKAAENEGVVNFVRIYNHPLFGKLDSRLDREAT